MKVLIAAMLTACWLGAYLVDGWRGVAIMAVAGALGELVLFWNALVGDVVDWRLRRSVRRRIRAYQAHDAAALRGRR